VADLRAPPELDLRRALRFYLRALRLRCPNCGHGKMFDRWVVQRPVCDHCRIKFERGELDYFIGAYTINLIMSELVVVAGMLFGMWLTWPDVPWNPIKWILLPLVILFPLFTYPFSKSLWLGTDLIYRPPRPEDFNADSAL
jgi:uncharacterized protein (DUF983 family)